MEERKIDELKEFDLLDDIEELADDEEEVDEEEIRYIENLNKFYKEFFEVVKKYSGMK